MQILPHLENIINVIIYSEYFKDVNFLPVKCDVALLFQNQGENSCFIGKNWTKLYKATRKYLLIVAECLNFKKYIKWTEKL